MSFFTHEPGENSHRMEETLRTSIPYSEYFVLCKGVSVNRIDIPQVTC